MINFLLENYSDCSDWMQPTLKRETVIIFAILNEIFLVY